MKFERRFGKRRKTNPKKGIYLVLLLVIALFLFFNAERILSKLL